MAYRVLKSLCVLFFLPIFVLCGCESKEETKQLITNFTSDFVAKFNDITIKGSLSVGRQGVINMSITYPDSLKNLNLSYKNSEVHITLDGLECSADEAYLPSSGFTSVLNSVLRKAVGLPLNNNNNYIIDLDNIKYKLSADSNGMITKIVSENDDFSIQFLTLKNDFK